MAILTAGLSFLSLGAAAKAEELSGPGPAQDTQTLGAEKTLSHQLWPFKRTQLRSA